MSCNGPCHQGDRPCPTPQACETAWDDDYSLIGREAAPWIAGIGWALVVLVVGALAIAPLLT